MSTTAEQTPPRKRLSGLRRRPLLTPVWLSLLLVIVLVVAGCWLWSSLATTTVIVVRHAEKELGSIEDPPLSAAGDQRAAQLGRMFGEKTSLPHVDAIFVSDTRRSQRTAAPLAQRLGLVPQVYNGRDIKLLIDRIDAGYRGRCTLVVGHSNTVPDIVHRLVPAVNVPAMPDGEYDTIYIVTVPTVGPSTVLRIKY
jgi:broad specificity phosphatase PhoE